MPILRTLREPQVAIAVVTIGAAALIAGVGLLAWDTGTDDKWAYGLLGGGGVLAAIGLVLLANPSRDRQGSHQHSMARGHSIAQAAGRDAINVGSIVQPSPPLPPILIVPPETSGILDSGVWWEYQRYEPLSLLLGARVPEVFPYCPEHKNFALQYQPRLPAGSRGAIRSLQPSDRPAIDEKRPLNGDGYIVCSSGKGHDVFLEHGTDSLANAWARAAAKMAAQMRESMLQEEDEAGIGSAGGSRS